MSQWTHVAGLIRIDNMGAIVIRQYPGDLKQEIKKAVTKALGATWDYDSERDTAPECGVPQGSEGSIQYEVLPPWSETYDQMYNVAIWGDLRDFGEEGVPGIAEWFQKSIEKLRKPEGFGAPQDMLMHERAQFMLSTFLIRDAVLYIDVEYGMRVVLLWDDKSHNAIKLPVPVAESAK